MQRFMRIRFFGRRPFLFFLIPGLVVYSYLIIYPIITTVYSSFTEWNGLGAKRFIGPDNFIYLFRDPIMAPAFYNALKNGVYLVGLSYAFQVPLALYFAYLLDRNIKGSGLYKLVIFLPQIMSMVSISFLCIMFFDPTFGILNAALTGAGLESWTKPWISWGDFMLYLVAALLTWKGVGIPTMLILANMKGIPKDYKEAAYLDGAGAWQSFRSVTLPLLVPAMSVTCIGIFLGAIGTFEFPFLVGDKTGGPGGVADTLGTLFYRTAFGNSQLTNNIGLGNAIAIVQFVIMLGFTWLLANLFRRMEVEY